MPLLSLEPFLHPENALEIPIPSGEEQTRWWVLHTRPRAEKSLARKLLQRQTTFFLPLYKRQWRSRGRLLCSFMPLFPGYLFLCGDHLSRHQALETNLVANCLRVPDQEQLRLDLLRVNQLIASGALLTPEDQLAPGTRVLVINGPLTGMEGTILRRGKALKFLIEVQFLQRGVSVEIDSSMFQPLNGTTEAGA